MDFFKKIRPLYFFLSFAFGLLCVYILTPPPKVVMKFPSPYNVDHVVYRSEDDDQCYKYKAEKSECPKDQTKIKPQPFIEDM